MVSVFPATGATVTRIERTGAEKFWYVLQNISFGSGYLAKVPVKKALSEAGLCDMTSAEKVWYVLMWLCFGGGYYHKVIIKKALNEAELVQRTGAEQFWYVILCFSFGFGYFGKIPMKKALKEYRVVTFTDAEQFWYVLQNISFGAGYFAKVPIKKALNESTLDASTVRTAAVQKTSKMAMVLIPVVIVLFVAGMAAAIIITAKPIGNALYSTTTTVNTTTTSMPTQNGGAHTTLYGANSPSVASECSVALHWSAAGFSPSPTFCGKEINVQAWNAYTKSGGVNAEDFGRNPSQSKFTQVMCDDFSRQTTLSTGYNFLPLLSAYYGYTSAFTSRIGDALTGLSNGTFNCTVGGPSGLTATTTTSAPVTNTGSPMVTQTCIPHGWQPLTQDNGNGGTITIQDFQSCSPYVAIFSTQGSAVNATFSFPPAAVTTYRALATAVGLPISSTNENASLTGWATTVGYAGASSCSATNTEFSYATFMPVKVSCTGVTTKFSLNLILLFYGPNVEVKREIDMPSVGI